MKLSLSKKAVLALSVILFPILITFIIGYRTNRELLTRHFLEDLKLIAEATEGQVYQFLEMGKRRTIDFTSDGFIVAELEKAKSRAWSPERLNTYLLSNKLRLDEDINAIAIASPEGKVIASTERSLIGVRLSQEPFFRAGQQGIGMAERPMGVYGRPDIVIAAPVKGLDSELIGVMMTFTDLSELGHVLTGEFNRKLGVSDGVMHHKQTFESYLVNADKLMLTRSRFLSGTVLRQKVDTLPVRSCIDTSQAVTGFYPDYRGVEVAGASMCMPRLGWTLLVEIDSSEALLPVSVIRKYAAFTALIIAALIAFIFLIFYKRIVLQLQSMARAAAAIARGDYDTRIPVRSSDEIGELCSSFNDMALQIRERNKSVDQSENRLKSILNNSSAIVYLKDLDGRYLFVNRQFERLFKANPGSLIGKTDHNLFPLEAADSFRKNDQLTLDNGFPMEFEEVMLREDGPHTYISIKFPLLNGGEKPYAVCGFSTDITERKHMELALKESERRLRRAQEIAKIGSWEWDIAANSLWWSDEIYRMFGLVKQDFGATFQAFLNCVHPEDREFVNRSVEQALYNRRPYAIDHRIVLPDGTEKFVHEQAELAVDADGRPVRMMGTVQDLTEQKRAEFELKKLSAVIEHSVNLVFITDHKGIIEYVNPTFERVTGYSKEDAIGQTPRVLSSGETTNAQYQELWNTVLSGKTWRSTMKNRTRTGGYYWATSVITPIKNDRGEITHFLAVQEDVTEKMMNEERIGYLANHDELTGLLNRSRFIDLVEHWITSAELKGRTGVLCLLDMDQFKLLNDTFGHGAGDEYLRRLANVLKDMLDDARRLSTADFDVEPVLSRLSGDEFACFLPGIGPDKGMALVEKIRTAVEGYYFTEASSSLTVSAGVAVYPEHGLNIKDLLSKADAAMYRAKELGRNRVHVYRPEDQDLEKMHSRLSWKDKIFKGLKEDRFIPWFQPLLDLKDNRIHHYEALARLISEDGKVLLPGAFIDIAERFGIVGMIDRVIIEKTMKKQAEMKAKGLDLSFGMNLSGKDLGDAELLDFIKTKIKETGADPRGLMFEITETAAIGDLEKATKFVRSLKDMGCNFSLDDFGVGFTSFTYLKEMQVDFIKIDGSFIRKLNESPNDQVFVKAITDLAKGLRIRSIAEFVENETTLELLKSFGVDFAQGYLVGKPSPELLGGAVTPNKEAV